MSSTVAPEVVLAGRYRLVRRLASGGMGQVWRAIDEILGRPVAVKLLRSEYAEDPEFLDRFRAEARRTAALSHPGIASVFDYGETMDPDADETTAYLVMELVDGEPLSALLAREGRLSPARVLDVLAQSALALDSAHQAGVVHRDVKPSNLLLRTDGVVKVTDFGIAHAADEAPRTEAGLVVGTAAYLSPEQVACRPATPASDVYALGVVAYECLAGRRPFTGEHPIALALAHRRSAPPPLPDDVPDTVSDLVAWAMSKAPRARPASAGALGREALVTRAGLLEGSGPEDLRTPTGGWLPVGGVWQPAIGRGPDSDDGVPPMAPVASGNGDRGPAPAGSSRGHRAGAHASGDAPGRRRAGDDGGGQQTGEWAPGPLLLAPGMARPRNHRKSVLAVMLALTVLLVGGVTAAAKERSVAVVPSVDGQRITAAGEALARAGFEVRERSRPDRTVRAGVVISQQPAAGTRLPRGRMVTMVVSSGPPIVVLDPSRYLGKPLDTVRAAMIRLGFRLSVTGRTGQAARGAVIAINPSGALHQGDAVTVTVATGGRRAAGA
jgi:serine/threonine-protein kinase